MGEIGIFDEIILGDRGATSKPGKKGTMRISGAKLIFSTGTAWVELG